MKLNFDYFFTNKYVLRFLLLHKLSNNKNTYSLPKINKLKIFFSLKKLEDLDSIEIYNYLYLFKYFFGKKAFLTKNNSYFVLGKWYYNFNVNIIVNNEKNIFFFIFFFFNNIVKNIDFSFIKKGFYNKKLNIFFFIIKDMNIFSEIKTNLGLFNLKKPLNLQLYFLGLDFQSTQIYLKNLKNIEYEKIKANIV